ncbi:MAG: acetoacetate--CoA ligase [Candidatus Heimdallarchaeota archaeon]|nr:acetoacetate--CoA ligase [Candidatus Heimdallarchaeota archaeon]
MKPLWVPSRERIEQANITKYMNFLNTRFSLDLKSYNDVYQFSIDKPAEFWHSIWDFTKIKYSRNFDEVVSDLPSFAPETRWFRGAKLNFAENLLRYRDDRDAILSKLEGNEVRRINYKLLYTLVARVSNALRSHGIQPGDRIVAYMPNIPQTIIYMLAATSIGATWASCGAELGEGAALDRLGQIDPKILFTVDAYIYKGQEFDHLTKVKYLSDNMPTLEKIVILPYINYELDLSEIPKACSALSFESKVEEIRFEQLDFDHPLFIMFSSGTTGKPKCMVQSAGGVLINHLKELVLHTDLKRSDAMLYLSSPSWMMWNWSVSALAVGATVAIYDGNPLYPDWQVIWEYIEQEKISVFGCSATYIHYLKSVGASPRNYDLTALREISQTGSALSDEGFDYVYKEIKEDLHFNSISGGTDINGCFAAGVPILPVYKGQLQARALGMKVVAYNLDAVPVYDEQGELICEQATPSMPLYFWDDGDNTKYHNAYFNEYQDKKVWRHGDYISIHSKTGGVSFYGRSDSVLKPSGVRIGTAEIYNIVEEIPGVLDSLAIGQQWNDDQRILLFIMLKEGIELSEGLQRTIRNELKIKGSPRHVPAIILHAPDIPYTFSGKKIASAITNIIHGREVTNEGAMRNPECLAYYRQVQKELQE